MCITEYDEARALAEQREDGREEGRAEGRAEGIDLYSSLISRLFDLGRGDEVERVARDVGYRRILFEEFGLK